MLRVRHADDSNTGTDVHAAIADCCLLTGPMLPPPFWQAITRQLQIIYFGQGELQQGAPAVPHATCRP
jgi:hypothetical protein